MLLLEREGELEIVAAALGGGSVVVVEGGAGIGKSSLLAASAARAEEKGMEILRARGSELEEGFAFGVVRQLFERRVLKMDEREREASFAGPAVAAAPMLSGQAGAAPTDDASFAILHGLYWLAVNLAANRPLLLVVDDAQWADGASLRWLAYLSPRLEGLPLGLLVAVRPTERAAADASLRALYSGATVVHPKLLSQDAVAAVVRDSIGDQAGDELCAAIYQGSGGNPFYLHELLRPVAAAGDILTDLNAAGLLAAAGQGVMRHLAARIEGLSPAALRLAQALAVLGDGCDLRHAAAIAEVDTDAAMRLAVGLVRLEILADDDPPRFLHPIVRQAVETSLRSDERDALHRAAARLLHGDRAAPGRVAAHLLRIRPAGDPWVVARLREAARAAMGSGAPEAGAGLLRRALAEPPVLEERVAVLREGALAEVLAGHEAGCGLLERALQLLADPRERAEVALELAEAHASLFRWVEAVDVCERALDELGAADPTLSMRIEGVLAVCALRDSRRALRALPVLEVLATRQLDGPTAEAYAVARGIEALWFTGRPAAEIARGLEAAFERGALRPESWDLRAPGLWALIVAEGYAAAEATLNAMETEIIRNGSARGMFVTYAIRGLLKLRLGALPEADADSRIALRVMQAGDFAPGLPLGLHVLAGVAIEAGDLSAAESLLDQLPREDVAPGLGTAHIAPARGRLRLAQGRAAEALVEFERALATLSEAAWGVRLHDNGFLHARSGAALALLNMGARERAHELAEAELEDARVFGAPRALGIALRVNGLTLGGEPGLEMLQQSVNVLKTSPALLERAHSLAELGAALRRAGRRAEAREPLAEALDLAARCGARPLAARAREELSAAGARPRREWRTGVEALTPSELRVARLATEGRTNREIAQALYVTPKTVEGHLARAYGKLGISGRDELRQLQGLWGEKTGVTTH
ncbi:MAG TPA: AAA family ATPase [Candidatus Dormibacteraeota bacterium]|nr:AAA family ATPase [Candidatus Dormibacteraeota bacterium]